MYCLNKKRKKEAIFKNVKKILPNLLIFVLFMFSLIVLLGFVTSESGYNLLENSKKEIFFDIKILNFESPMELGEFFEFTYLVKGMTDINKDIEIHFWIEKQGEIIASGSDTIYIGDFEEKIETTKIFLPKNVESGVYDFIVEVVYEDYEAKSHRTIEIEIKKGIAKITTSEGKVLNTYFICALIGLAIFVLSFIFFLKRKKIKKHVLQGEKFIHKYNIFILTLFLFIILAILIYYLDFFGEIIKGISKLILVLRINVLPYFRTSSFYYIFGIILGLVVLICLIVIAKKKEWFKTVTSWFRKKRIKRTHVNKLKEKYKAGVKESKIKFKKISKSQNKLTKKLKSFIKKINPLKLIKFLLNFLKKKIILFVRLIKKLKIKKKHRVVKIVKKRKKPEKLKKKVKIKHILGKYHPFKHIKRFFEKITRNLKKLKIKLPKKPKKKETLVKIKKASVKQKKLEVSKKLKFKKIGIRIRRIGNRLGIIIRKILRYLKSKFRLFGLFISKEERQIIKDEKRALKDTERELKETHKNIFRFLRRVFGRKSKKRIIKEFEKVTVNTKNFSEESLRNLKELTNIKKRFKKRKLNLHKLEEVAKSTENLVSELTINFGNLLSLKKKKKKFKNKLKSFFLKITPKKLFQKRRKLEQNHKLIKEFFDQKLEGNNNTDTKNS